MHDENRKSELIKLYCETDYQVFITDTPITVRIDKAIPYELNKLIEQNHNKTGVILTAYNPRSEFYQESENKRRNNKLKAVLIEQNFDLYLAKGQGNQTNWPAEESFFILNMSADQAEHHAVNFGQYAYVVLESSKTTSLVFSEIWNQARFS